MVVIGTDVAQNIMTDGTTAVAAPVMDVLDVGGVVQPILNERLEVRHVVDKRVVTGDQSTDDAHQVVEVALRCTYDRAPGTWVGVPHPMLATGSVLHPRTHLERKLGGIRNSSLPVSWHLQHPCVKLVGKFGSLHL